MTIKLIEADTSSNGVRARMKIISAGLGSSGFYSAETLERDGASAFPAGTHIFYNHIGAEEKWETGGARDIRDLVGKTLTEAEYVPDDEALWADVLFYTSRAESIREISEDIGASIEASGTRDEESGEITSLVANPNNRIALTPVPGRDGRISHFMESFRDEKLNLFESGKIEDIDNNPEKDKQDMKPEDIQAIVDAVKSALEPRLAEVEENLKPEKVEAPAVAEVFEALIEADLPKDLRARVYGSANPLEELKTIKAIKESLSSKTPAKQIDEPGHIQESSKTGESFLSGVWGGNA